MLQGVEDLNTYQEIQKSIELKIKESSTNYKVSEKINDPIRMSIAIREQARASREIAQDLRRYSRMLKRA